MLVIVYGNPFDGLAIVGPFEDTEEANHYGEMELRNFEYWVIAVETPEDE